MASAPGNRRCPPPSRNAARIIVDGDVIAREVVQPGTEGLASLVEAFGDDILLPDGSLDRPALAAKAFRDDEARQKLNGIVHPLVGKRRAEIIAAVSEDAVVVEDIPLLVESGMAPLFPLVVVVHADVELRVRRLVEQRGMSEEDARARIAAQADDEQRRAVADIWLDNSGSPEDLVERARDVWNNRILPFAHNLSAASDRPGTGAIGAGRSDLARPGAAHRRPAEDGVRPQGVARRPHRVDRGAGIRRQGRHRHPDHRRITGGGRRTRRAVAVRRLPAHRAHHRRTSPRPMPAAPSTDYDHSDDPALWRKRIHASADPGRPTNVHIRVDGWPNQQFALLFVDWLAANPDGAGRLPGRQARGRKAGADGDTASYVAAKEPWFLDAYRRAWEWADSTGWRP